VADVELPEASNGATPGALRCKPSVDTNATSFTVPLSRVRYTALMQVKLPRAIRTVFQIGFVLALIPVICAPFLIGGAQWINWLVYGNWPDWSPLALGWWNPAAHRTRWGALDRVLDTAAGSNVVALCVLILMAVAACGWVTEWREKRAFEEWYKKRVLTLHRIDASPAATAPSQRRSR
jgi:hypothetical protein